MRIVTGVIRSIAGALAVVRPNGTGDDQAPWPDVQDCRVLSLTGSNNTASLSMNAMAGDECILLFAGEDKTSPFCIPCAVSAPGTVALRHGDAHVTVNRSTVLVSTGASSVSVGKTSVAVSANRIDLNGSVTVMGDLSVAGSMLNGGKNIGASHKHSNGTAQDGNTGVVL